MNPLVLIIEDDDAINKMFSSVLEKKGISFISASNLPDAIELFNLNEGVISYIALDGNLKHKPPTDEPETLVLARIIANSQHFKGTVFAMSSVPNHCIILKEAIGDRCEILVTECHSSIKLHTIRKIAQMIIEKREEGQKS